MPRGLRASAIDKLPVTEPVYVGRLGLDGDEQAERRFHGGPFKAVYAYAVEDLDWWSTELGRVLPPGFLGENLTTEGINFNELRVGDELHAGASVLRITEPRDPCAKLAARLGIKGFERRFGRAQRTGVYCAVERPGFIRAGDPIAAVRVSDGGPIIRDIVREGYGWA